MLPTAFAEFVVGSCLQEMNSSDRHRINARIDTEKR